MNKQQPPFPQGTYLLFDNDCGICTTASHFFKRLLGSRIDLIPMHIPQVEQEGKRHLGESYWDSFHIVRGGQWTVEGSAILALAKLFPLGSLWSRVAAIGPVFYLLKKLLSTMQSRRKVECKLDLG